MEDTGMRRGDEKSGTKERSSIVVRKKSWELLMVEFLKVGWNSLVREGIVESTGWSE